MVVSMTSDIGDGRQVASKGGEGRNVGDNGVMTCGTVYEGGVEASGANGVDDVDGGNIISHVDRLARPQPQIGRILTEVDDIGGLMDGPYDVDVFPSCA